MYSVWAQKRRFKIHLVIGSIGLIAFLAYIQINIWRPPTCFDHKRNQDEVGIDCGGSCSLLCYSQTQELSTLWAQTFEIVPGAWSAVAYVENPNFQALAETVPYKFTLYDRAGSLILEKVGTTYIIGEPVIPIFSGRMEVGSRVPYRVTFEWLTRPVWLQLHERHQVSFEEQQVDTSGQYPEIRAVVVNTEPVPLKDVEVVVIVYDKEQNAIAASQTYVDILQPREKHRITFSWPQPFSTTPGRIELLPRIPVQE